MEQRIKIAIDSHSMLRIIDCEPGVIQELSDYYTFEVPGAKYMPAVKAKRWDGKIRMLNRKTGEINSGLYYSIKKFCQARNYILEIDCRGFDHPEDKNKINHISMIDWIESLDAPFKPMDYQYEAFTHAVTHKRSILRSPTASGKSFIIYLLIQWFLKYHDDDEEKVILIVPTTSLVEQMYNDFKEYGMKDIDKNVHRIYSGKDKETEKRVIISTWQSIFKLHVSWFKKFGCIIGDEVHGFKATSLSSIMNKSVNAKYRWGTTGTLDGTEVNQLLLEGLYGPVKIVTESHKLQERGILSKLEINMIVLKHDKDKNSQNEKLTYQQEVDYIIEHQKRNNFISNLAVSLEGNTLIMFNYVDRHGEVLRNILEKKVEDRGKKLYYVSGKVHVDDREQIRKIVDNNNNSILLASYGTFSTGINIKNIHNIIFAISSKSQIRVLQTIGRGLRLSKDGSTTRLYDISDYMGRNNFSMRHCEERKNIYSNEKWNYKVLKINI